MSSELANHRRLLWAAFAAVILAAPIEAWAQTNYETTRQRLSSHC